MIDIKAVREKTGLSMSALAAKLGVTRMTLYRWETGQSPIKPIYLREIKRISEEVAQE